MKGFARDLGAYTDSISCDFRRTRGANYFSCSKNCCAKNRKRESKIQARLFLLVDMGGASSEFVLCGENGNLARSFDIGIVSAKERYGSVEKLLAQREEF